jgi:hypothetical protein
MIGGLKFYEEPRVLRFLAGKLKPTIDWSVPPAHTLYARLSGMFRAALWMIFQRRLRSSSVTSLVSFW